MSPIADIEVRFDEKDLMDVAGMVSHIRHGMARVQMGAINKTLRSLRTHFTRHASEISGIKQKAIRKGIRLLTASRAHLVGHVILNNVRIPLIELNARQTQKGVTFRGRQSRQLKRHAFITRMASGHKGVFRRASVSGGGDFDLVPRLPIYEQMGPSIAHLFRDTATLEAETMTKANSLLSHYLDQEINWILERYSG